MNLEFHRSEEILSKLKDIETKLSNLSSIPKDTKGRLDKNGLFTPEKVTKILNLDPSSASLNDRETSKILSLCDNTLQAIETLKNNILFSLEEGLQFLNDPSKTEKDLRMIITELADIELLIKKVDPGLRNISLSNGSFIATQQLFSASENFKEEIQKKVKDLVLHQVFTPYNWEYSLYKSKMDPSDFVNWRPLFDVTTPEGQKGLIEIAKNHAQWNQDFCRDFKKKYPIDCSKPEGQKALHAIAMLHVNAFPKSMSSFKDYFIDGLGIDSSTAEGEQIIVKLISIMLKDNPMGVIYLDYIPLHSSKLNLSLLLQAFSSDPFALDLFNELMPRGRLFSKVTLDENARLIGAILKKMGGTHTSNNKEELEKKLEGLKTISKLIVPHLDISYMLEVIAKVAEKEIEDAKKNERKPDFYVSNKILESAYRMIAKLGSVFADASSQEWINKSGLLSEIMDLRAPSLRLLLVDFIAENYMNNLAAQQAYSELQSNEKVANVSHTILPALYMAIWPNCSTEERTNFIETLKKSKGKNQLLFREGPVMQALLSTLDSVSKLSKLSDEDKHFLLKNLINNPSILLKNLRAVSTIINLSTNEALELRKNNLENLLEKHKSFQEVLNQLVKMKFTEIIPLKDMPDFSEKLFNLMDGFRDFSTIYTYVGCINKLNAEEKNSVMATFAAYLENVMQGSFKEWRYSPFPMAQNEQKENKKEKCHLEHIFEKLPALKDVWSKNNTYTYADMVSSKVEGNFQTPPVDFNKLLLQSFHDKHFDRTTYPNLVAFLEEGDLKQKKEIKTQLSERLKQAKGLSKDELGKLKIEQLTLLLCESTQPEKSISILTQLSKYLPEGEFKADIEALKKNLEKLASPVDKNLKSKWTVVETDDPCDLFHCGTEVEGSCQSVYREPHLNKCLIGYLADGKNRLIAIKDENGKIVARAFLRLLWNKKNQQPVLFLERLYPNILEEEQKNIIIETAKRKASELGVVLLNQEVKKGQKYSGEISSLNGRSPFEYVDAFMGWGSAHEVKEGKFDIQESYILQPVEDERG